MDISWNALTILRETYGNPMEILWKSVKSHRNLSKSYRISMEILWNLMEILWKSYGNAMESCENPK